MSENITKEDALSTKKPKTFLEGTERMIQLIVGVVMWFTLMFIDYNAHVNLLEMSEKKLFFTMFKYAVAWGFIHGITIQDIVLLLNAWRKK